MLLPNRGPVQFTMNQDFPVDLRHLHTCIVYLNMALNDLCIFCTPNNQDTQGKENGCNITSLPLALSFLRSVMGWIKKALDILDDSNYKITPIVVKSVAEANHDLVVSVGIHRGKFATIIEVSNLPTFRPMTPPNIIDGSTNKTHDRSYAGGNLASTKEFRIFSDFPKVASTQEVLQKCLVELTSILDQIESMVLLYA